MVMPGRRPTLRGACRSAVATPATSRTASTTGGCNASYGCACRGSGLFPSGAPFAREVVRTLPYPLGK
eukprot:254773-Lingulodinium_polyedra.AAC.1